VPVYHDKFGTSLDYAFASSRGFQGNPNRTLDNTAVTWMTVFNFSPREDPMATAEKVYQLKGHAKFVDIARLFGWQVLGDYWYSFNYDYENSNPIDTSDDGLILRLAIAVGVDVTPLLHFWGIHPQNASALAADIAAEGLQQSTEIYDLLVYYKTLVLVDNAAFQTFVYNWWGHEPNVDAAWTEVEHARQWDTTSYWQGRGWDYSGTDPAQADGEIYNEATCDRIKAVVDAFIELYFPDGNPGGDADATANADIAVSGTVSGSYTDTRVTDDGYESITERESGGNPNNRYSYLEHKWTVNVRGGDSVTFFVEAYQSASSDGDNFIFAYSTNDSSYTNMVTVTKTADDNGYQSYVMPASLSGTVYIRVVDTDQTQGNRNLDTISIDHMFIRSAAPGPPCTPTDMHIEAVACGEVSCGGPNKNGQVTVTIYDDCGNPVSDALVDVTFTGDISETINDTATDSNGQAVITSTACVKRPSFTVTVTDVTGALPYDSNDNLNDNCSG
jgi:hypothetical protein